MKIAIISDIHSNLQALRAVLKDIERQGTQLVICAGDIVGYGADPNECTSIVSRVVHTSIYGNHELSALSGDTTWMNPFAAVAAIWTGKNLDKASRDYLKGLELSAVLDLSNKRIAMYHGSVGSATEYVYEEAMSQELFESARADVLILGHTHVPYVVRFGSYGLAINPGSVGQPRDSDPRASYAVLDLDRMDCETRRLDYDVEGAARSIRLARLPEILAERLFHGR